MKQDCNFNEFNYSNLIDYVDGEPSKEREEQIISWFQNPDYQFKLEQCLKEF
jgi:hypothetical protein